MTLEENMLKQTIFEMCQLLKSGRNEEAFEKGYAITSASEAPLRTFDPGDCGFYHVGLTAKGWTQWRHTGGGIDLYRRTNGSFFLNCGSNTEIDLSKWPDSHEGHSIMRILGVLPRI